MTDYENYEKEVEEIRKRNEEYIDKFEKWLQSKGLVLKTIESHLSNIDLYLNDYLNYYDTHKMEDGCRMINNFLGDWFIRKCMWSTASSVKSTAASIKKFYQCMTELGYIEKENYQELCNTIKENMEYWIESVEEYNSDNFDGWGFF